VSAPILHLGLPDRFVDHGDQALLLAAVGLDAEGIAAKIQTRLAPQPEAVTPLHAK
jgi:1-deoxy-D-xylulose-5-phosphate synthase